MRLHVGSTDDFPEGPCHAIIVHDKSLLIIRTAAEFFAVLNQCPHMGLRLDNGTVIGTVLVCLWHGAQFDLATGQCLRWAVNEPPPEAVGETRRPLIAFPVIIEERQVFVELSEP